MLTTFTASTIAFLCLCLGVYMIATPIPADAAGTFQSFGAETGDMSQVVSMFLSLKDDMNKRDKSLNGRIDEIIKSGDKRDKSLNGRIDEIIKSAKNLDKSLNGRMDEIVKSAERLDKSLNVRMDDMDKSLNGRMDKMDKSLNGRMDEIVKSGKNLDKSLNGRMDKIVNGRKAYRARQANEKKSQMRIQNLAKVREQKETHTFRTKVLSNLKELNTRVGKTETNVERLKTRVDEQHRANVVQWWHHVTSPFFSSRRGAATTA